MRNIFILICLVFSLSAFAQKTTNEAATKTAAPNGRYEIVQCPIARKFTIKIDKQTGETWQMVADENDNLCWQEVYRARTPQKDTNYDDKINYQIFMGGITAKDMILLNVNTGATWQLVYDSKKKCNWWIALDKE